MTTRTRDCAFRRTLLGIVALGSAAVASEAQAVPGAPEEWEKCAGVALKGKNDCGSLDGSHACAGMAKKDKDPQEWVYVPEGVCEKIGGRVAKIVPAKDDSEEDAA
ncbi:BufA1 family periplasmic bufferin-type metallophore [Tautonia sociabilis]|uniref:DUF2282 domain-containing protein n=1 Tax=Tautonia sociabilis TaxID=2080755 RepID=A0A432MKJ4_9BACT|nr:DUF2282 domain-containing protein [Tautonia sociabilis]RUL87944.1 DUF2282 domain-containing protein [Tautonia sociabilis]